MPTQKESIKKFFFASCRIAISFGALFLVVFMFRSKLHDVGRILLETKLNYLLLAITAYFAGFCIITYRLKIILAVQQIHMSIRNLVSIGLIGLFFNNLLPSSIGGDAVKAYYAYKITGKKLESFSSIFVDRVLGLFTLIGLALLALFFFRSELSNPKITEAVLALSIASFLMFAFFASRRVAKRFKIFSFLIPSEKFREKIRSLYHSVNGYRDHPGAVFAGLGLSFLSQSLFILVNFFLALGLKIHIPVWVFFILIPIVGTVSMAPSLNGLGVREGAYIYLFSHYCSSEEAFALSILNYFILVIFSLAGGLFYLARKLVLVKDIASVDMIDEIAHLEEEKEAEDLKKGEKVL